MNRPRIALISATPAAIDPATSALAAEFPAADVWNLLDDKLLADADERGGLGDDLAERMRRLIDHAVAGGADLLVPAGPLSFLWGEEVSIDPQGMAVTIPLLGDSEATLEMTIADASRMMSLMRERFPSDDRDLQKIEFAARRAMAGLVVRVQRRDRDKVVEGGVKLVMDNVLELVHETHDARLARQLSEQHNTELRKALELAQKKAADSDENGSIDNLRRMKETLDDKLGEMNQKLSRATTELASREDVLTRLRESHERKLELLAEKDRKLEAALKANRTLQELREAEMKVSVLREAEGGIRCGSPEDHDRWGAWLEQHLELLEDLEMLANELDKNPFTGPMAQGLRVIVEKYQAETD